jgi:hypothetical protein
LTRCLYTRIAGESSAPLCLPFCVSTLEQVWLLLFHLTFCWSFRAATDFFAIL